MEQEPWAEAFQNLVKGAATIKADALNRHDRDFAPWHRQARSVLLRYCPVKIPAFDEIRFASDFFLGRNGEDQFDINDRIALVSDIDLALEIFEQARELVQKDERFRKSRERIGGSASIETPDRKPPSPAENKTPEPAQVKEAGGQDPLLARLQDMDLSQREKDEVREELERVIRILEQPDPDWDRIKRTVKFLLDFDKTLALATVPEILQRYQHPTPR